MWVTAPYFNFHLVNFIVTKLSIAGLTSRYFAAAKLNYWINIASSLTENLSQYFID
jgi:hypothetical protein